MDDEFDWDGEVVDLDAGDVTGDPQLDVYGYQSPKQRGGAGSRPPMVNGWRAVARSASGTRPSGRPTGRR